MYEVFYYGGLTLSVVLVVLAVVLFFALNVPAAFKYFKQHSVKAVQASVAKAAPVKGGSDDKPRKITRAQAIAETERRKAAKNAPAKKPAADEVSENDETGVMFDRSVAESFAAALVDAESTTTILDRTFIK